MHSRRPRREKASGHQPDRNVQALQIHRGGWKERVLVQSGRGTTRRFPRSDGAAAKSATFSSFLHLCDRASRTLDTVPKLTASRWPVPVRRPEIDGRNLVCIPRGPRGNKARALNLPSHPRETTRRCCNTFYDLCVDSRERMHST